MSDPGPVKPGVGEQEGGEIAGLTAGPVGELQRFVISVEDDGGHPVGEAAICLSGPGLPALGFTGADGLAELTVAGVAAPQKAQAKKAPAS